MVCSKRAGKLSKTFEIRHLACANKMQNGAKSRGSANRRKFQRYRPFRSGAIY